MQDHVSQKCMTSDIFATCGDIFATCGGPDLAKDMMANDIHSTSHASIMQQGKADTWLCSAVLLCATHQHVLMSYLLNADRHILSLSIFLGPLWPIPNFPLHST
jgi:hypothetical protein